MQVPCSTRHNRPNKHKSTAKALPLWGTQSCQTCRRLEYCLLIQLLVSISSDPDITASAATAPRLIDQLRSALRFKDYSVRAEQACVCWVRFHWLAWARRNDAPSAHIGSAGDPRPSVHAGNRAPGVGVHPRPGAQRPALPVPGSARCPDAMAGPPPAAHLPGSCKALDSTGHGATRQAFRPARIRPGSAARLPGAAAVPPRSVFAPAPPGRQNSRPSAARASLAAR